MRLPRIVLVTAPDLSTARRLARASLRMKLAACVNIFPRLESHYWWQGKLEQSAEVLLLIKTTRPALGKLKEVILKNHPYDTPEFLVLGIESGSQRYLAWLADSVRVS